MQPVLAFAVGGMSVAITSYRLMFFAAALATFGIGLLVAWHRGAAPGHVAICLAAAALVAPIGARLWDAATKWPAYAADPSLLTSTSLHGMSLYGGLFSAAAVAAVASRPLGLNLARLADSVAPALGVGIALMRVGCFLAGCCFGKTTDLPWGVTFPAGSDAHVYQMLNDGHLFSLAGPKPVHPTQLYELLAALIAVGIAAVLIRRRAPDGVPFLAAIAWYDAFRIGNHYQRASASPAGTPDWFYPALYVILLTAVLAGLAARPRSGRQRGTVPLQMSRSRISGALIPTATAINAQEMPMIVTADGPPSHAARAPASSDPSGISPRLSM